MKKLQTSRIDDSLFEQSDYIDTRVFAASANEDHTVPGDAAYVLVSATADTWIKFGGTAAVPAADVTDGAGQILVKASVPKMIRLLSGSAKVTTLGIIPEAAAKVSLEFFR